MPFQFTTRFFGLLAAIATLFVLCWQLSLNIDIPRIAFTALFLLTLTDALSLFLRKKGVHATRILPERFSNGDKNAVVVKLRNFYSFKVHINLAEELPAQFQSRNNTFNLVINKNEQQHFQYYLRPLLRGEYEFGATLLFICSPLGLIKRRISCQNPATVKVYPSYMQMRRYELLARSAQQAEAGNKQLRKIGHSLEFEQIKEYVSGDDIRSINWKASARKGGMMVNHYVEERSQQVYCIIDTGRLMKMPFDGLSLLDYAINASLVLCNVSLHRQDKFGLINFSNKQGTFLPADRKPIQLEHTLQALYNINTQFLESDFEKLYLQVRSFVKNRSLLVLFTNFESTAGMRRQLPYLKQMSRHHLLLVVFFENAEVKHIAEAPVNDLESIYTKTIAGKFVLEKRLMVKELQQHGILSILTPPKGLTINVINKYLELKSRQAV